MTKTQNEHPRNVLNETATSIKKLALELENREMEGGHLTATEIQTIARQLQAHVEDLLSASRNLRDQKSE